MAPTQSAKQRKKTGKSAALLLCLLAVCAALVIGIVILRRMSAQKQATEPEAEYSKDYSQLSVEVFLAMPTGLELGVVNQSYQDIALPEKYVICQDGTQVAEFEREAFSVSNGQYLYLLNFAELPAGQKYTLSAVTEDGVSAGAFSSVPFEVSQVFDQMVWIPDVKGMMIDEAEPLLTEKGVQVEKSFSASTIAEIADGEVVAVTVPRKQINWNGDFPIQDECYDGKGYWVEAGDQVILDVNTQDGE